MKILSLLLALGIFGYAEYPSTHVDLIELSHVYDTKGRLIFDQVIFWEQNRANGRFQVRSWTLCNDCYPITFDGITKFESAEYRAHSTLFRESWSQEDPERANKKHWPEDQRFPIPKKSPKKAKTDETSL